MNYICIKQKKNAMDKIHGIFYVSFDSFFVTHVSSNSFILLFSFLI